MRARQVTEIDSLAFGFTVSVEEGLTLTFRGPTDAVRLAARDLIYGLGTDTTLLGVGTRVTHVSEKLKMENSYLFREGQAQINLTLSLDRLDFDQLVKVARYIKQLGYAIYTSPHYPGHSAPLDMVWEYPASSCRDDSFLRGKTKWGHERRLEPSKTEMGEAHTLHEYLDAIIKFADKYPRPLCIQPYSLKFNRCFWLEGELQADAEKRANAKRASQDTTTLFSGTSNRSHAATSSSSGAASSSSDTPPHTSAIEDQIRRQQGLILSDIHAIYMNHPSNNGTVDDVSMYLLTYGQLKGKNPNYDMLRDANYSKIFPFIRPDQRAEFIELAEAYLVLSEQRRQLEPVERSVTRCNCLVM